ncbi:hypothetical protein ACJ7VZ_05380 [Aeromonas salmonicida]|uniref:hypothetical protein n=1 Tax=Aeromonas salmonicida TaxID=645 RepID=UPI0038B994CE
MNDMMKNEVVQLNVVIIFLKEGNDVNKSKFAKERDMSRRTLDRWIAKYQDEALQIIKNENEKVEVIEPIEIIKKVSVVSKNASVNKRDLAAKVFADNDGMKRSDLIDLMVAKCGLTAAGASTYISNFKTGKWAVE